MFPRPTSFHIDIQIQIAFAEHLLQTKVNDAVAQVSQYMEREVPQWSAGIAHLGIAQHSFRTQVNDAVAQVNVYWAHILSQRAAEIASLKNSITAFKNEKDSATRQIFLQQSQLRGREEQIARLRTKMNVLEMANVRMHERAEAAERSVKDKDAVHKQQLRALLQASDTMRAADRVTLVGESALPMQRSAPRGTVGGSLQHFNSPHGNSDLSAPAIVPSRRPAEWQLNESPQMKRPRIEEAGPSSRLSAYPQPVAADSLDTAAAWADLVASCNLLTKPAGL
ncbi:hypothetical protein C8R43DRAFT_699883 [Mycena crocata]|nr:hypothetical protein C8R43DRAFT_699883 [Mycena crocata]